MHKNGAGRSRAFPELWNSALSSLAACFRFAAHAGERQGDVTSVPIGLAAFAFDFRAIRKFADRDH